MKKFSTRIVFAACMLVFSVQAIAGNKDRSGQAGATELLLNPWAQSTGVFGLNTANVSGLEAIKNNVAGLAFVEKTEIGVSHAIYLSGSQVSINNLGLAQRLGNAGVIGFNIMSVGFGDITLTDYNNPEGYGTYRPQFLNMQLAFAKEFSNSIHAGVAVTYVSEQLSNINASGVCFDAGIEYVTGKRDNFHFGITLRNMGTTMGFSGSGFAIDGEAPQSQPSYAVTARQPSADFDMPTNLSIGVAYDFYLDGNHLKSAEDKPKHRLTVMGNFTSNSFNNDYLGLGLEYCFLDMFMLRTGYRYEKGIFSATESTTMYNGFACGATVQKRLGNKGPMLAVDYSYRPTVRPANGVHVISLRFMRK